MAFPLRLLRLAALLVFSFLFSNSISADTKIDSLYQIVQETSGDSLKLAAYIDFLYEIKSMYHPDIEKYADELLAYAKDKNSIKGIAHAYMYKGFAKTNEQAFDKAIKNYEISLANFLKLEDYQEVTKVQKVIYLRYKALGNIEQTDIAFKEYERFVEKVDDNYHWGDLFMQKAERAAINGKINKMEEFAQEALKRYEFLGEDYDFNRAMVLANIANTFLDSNPSKSIEYLAKAKLLAKSYENVPKFLAYVIGLQATANQLIGNYETAIALSFEEIALFDSLQFPNSIVEAKGNLGNLYTDLNEQEKAKEIYEDALLLAQEVGFLRGQITSFAFLAELYQNQEDYKKAILYYEKSNSIADSVQENGLKLQNMPPLAMAYIKSGQAEKGYQMLVNALEESNGEFEGVDRKAYLGLADYYFQKKEWRKAIEYAQKSYQISKENETMEKIPEITSILYQSNKELKQHREALKWLEIEKEAEATILNESNIKTLTAARMNADFAKEKEIIAIEQAQQEVLLKAETAQTRTAALSIGALALLGFGFFYNARRKNKIIAATNAQLEEINQTKDRLFTIIAHDLRKPALAFRGISKKVNFLLQEQDFDTLNKYGDSLQSAAHSLNSLLDNLLNWALQQRNMLPYAPTEINVAEVTAEIIDLYQQMVQQKNIHIKSTLSSSEKVFVDYNAYATIVRNVLDNAIKFTPKGGVIELATHDDSEKLVLTIKDSGRGMTAEQLSQLFDLKKNKSTRGTAGETGTGLGLSLVNDLVNLNKGSIAVESVPNEGTIFKLGFPTKKSLAS